MARETALEKSRRLLAEGRVHVLAADQHRIAANVVGEHGSYRVTVDPWGATCTCQAGAQRCSHARAVALITSVHLPEP